MQLRHRTSVQFTHNPLARVVLKLRLALAHRAVLAAHRDATVTPAAFAVRLARRNARLAA